MERSSTDQKSFN